MKKLVFIGFFALTSSLFGQVNTIDRSDTSIHIVSDYWYHDHWVLYPATSAVYVPPCVYRIIPPDTSHSDFIDPYDYGNREQYSLVEQDGKYGIINSGDTIIIPLQYDSLIRITNTKPKVFIAQKQDKYGLLNDQHKEVVPFEYDRIHLMTNGQYFGLMSSMLSVEKDGKKGLLRVDGSVELSCSYEEIDISCAQTDCPKEGVQYYVKKEGRYGYINQDESVAIPFKYDALNAKGFSVLIKAKNKGKVGLMDTLEHFIVPQEYEELYKENMWRYPNITAFKQDGKWGLMCGDYANMKIILENKYDSVFCNYAFEDHFIIVNNGKEGLADTTGKVVIKPQYEAIIAMEDGTFGYKKDGKWGFMSKTGSIHCAPRYDLIFDNDRNWCLVKKGEGYGFCKTSGEEIAAPIYQLPYQDDYVHWEGLLYTGHIALSKVRNEDDYVCKMGVIDSTGKVLLPFEYDCLDDLVYGFGNTQIAVRNDKQVIINKNGKELDLGDYDVIERARYDYGYFFPKKGDKVGLVSPYGKVISIPKYDDIEVVHVGGEGLISKRYILVKMGSKFGLLDSNGTQVLAPEHEALSIKYNDKVEIVSGDQVKIYNLTSRQYESFTTLDNYQFNGHVGVFRGHESKAFFIDKNGKRINGIDYQHIWHTGPADNYFSVDQKGLIGICDSLGKELFAPKFTKIKYWDGTFGAGKLNNRYCFFDAKGDTLVGYRYEKVKGVYKDFVSVRMNQKFGVVNKKGYIIVEPSLQTKLNFDLLLEYKLMDVVIDNKVGVMNSAMELIIPAKFDSVRFVEVYNKVYVLCFIQGICELHDANGVSVSSHLFNKWEYDNADELLLSDGLSWFQLTANGNLLEIDR